MSEFSKSLHLFDVLPAKAAELIRVGGARGILAPLHGRWLSLVVEGDRPSRALLDANHGLLLCYAYAEDHGWEFELYERNRTLAHYKRSWDPRPRGGRLASDVSPERLAELLQVESRERFSSILRDEPPPEPSPVPYDRALEFARVVGLSQVEWFSYHYAQKNGAYWCDACGVGSVPDTTCLVCRRAANAQLQEVDDRDGPAGFAAARLLARIEAEGAIELTDNAPREALADRLLAFFDDLGVKPSGRALGEWLMNQPEVAEVFAADEELEALLEDLT